MSAENLEAVKKDFGDDLDASRFSIQLTALSDVVSGVSIGVSGGRPPPGLEKFQGKLCFQGKRYLLKNPE